LLEYALLLALMGMVLVGSLLIVGSRTAATLGNGSSTLHSVGS